MLEFAEVRESPSWLIRVRCAATCLFQCITKVDIHQSPSIWFNLVYISNWCILPQGVISTRCIFPPTVYFHCLYIYQSPSIFVQYKYKYKYKLRKIGILTDLRQTAFSFAILLSTHVLAKYKCTLQNININCKMQTQILQ